MPAAALPLPSPALPTHDEIARLAHSFWEARGHTHGASEQDWYRAERELLNRPSFADPAHRL
jgi:hypothetical protein